MLCQLLSTPVGERFLPEVVAGIGGMGTVYRARDTRTGETVALKLLQSAGRPHEVERFTREAQILSELHHPGIVAYLAHGVTNAGQPYLAMEWLEGEDLATRLARGALSLFDSLTLIQRTAEALTVAHGRGLVHRDLKPSNLFLRGGAVDRVALLDFGIARQEAEARPLTGSGVALGTPAYMAPEQARGERDLTPAADIFSLGCVLYECLTGQPAFAAEHPLAVLGKILFAESPRLRHARPDLPEAIEALLDRMFARRPEARLPDAAALLGAISSLSALPRVAASPTLDAPSPCSGCDAEQLLISVLIATPTAREGGLPGATAPDDRLREFSTVLAALEARAEVMADGSLVATLVHARGAATDQAGLLARGALLLKARWPEAAIAVCTGRGVLRGASSVGEALDRAADLLRGRPSAQASEQILLDEITRGLLGVRFHVQKTPSGTYALTGEELTLDERRPLLGKPTPCVGRESELGVLELAFASCVDDGAPQAVLVTAPPGAGKSRLRHELVRRLEAREDPPLVLIGRGDPMSAGSAYGLLGQALRRLCGVLDGEDPALRREKLARRVAENLPAADRPRVVAFLGELCGVPFPDDDNLKLRSARQDPLVMSDQITWATLDFLRAECAARPVVLVLEDLHWGDALTVKLCDAALRTLSDRPLLVLALARPDVEELFPKLWGSHVQALPLRPLNRKAGERLVRQVLGPQVPPETVARIVEQSEGNALFLEELIRGVAEGHGDEAPETVLAMLQARIGRLPPGARWVLRAASVFGATFWLGGLRALLDAPSFHGSALGEALQVLLQHEILEERREGRFPGEQEYRFRHALMRDAAYGLLTEEERGEGHRQAGEYLLLRGEQDALVLAEHFVKGQQKDRAIDHYIQAAEQSLEAHDPGATLTRAERGLACGASGERRGALLSLLITACLWSERYGEIIALGNEAIELLPKGSDRWCRALRYVAMTAAFAFQNALFVQLASLFASTEPCADAYSSYSITASWLSISFAVVGRRDASRAFLDRARSFLDHVARDDVAFRHFKRACANYHHTMEEAPWTRELAGRESMQGAQDAGDRQNECLDGGYYGDSLLNLGDRARAEAVLRENLALAERLNDTFLLPCAKVFLAIGLASSAPLDQLDEPARLARDVIRGRNASLIGFAYGALAEVKLRLGDRPGAEEEARAACEAVRPFPPYAWVLVALRMRIVLEQGRAAEALELGEGALAELERLRLEGYGEVHLRLAVAEALDAVGQVDAARAALAKALERLRVRVDDIPDEAARERYLTQVPTNAHLVALAEEWLGVESLLPFAMSLPRREKGA